VYAQIEFNVPLNISKVQANQENKANFYSGTELKIAFSKEVKGEKFVESSALANKL
jgi:hypothetical protein